MTMENEMHNGFGGYGFLLTLIFFIWLIFGGGFGGNGGRMAEAEKQGIIDSARTQYLVEHTAHATQAELAGVQNLIGNKIDYYAYQNERDKQQDLRDQLAQERAKNIALEGRIYSDAKFGALEAQIQAMNCAMLKQPQVYGIAGACVPMYVPPFPTTSSSTTTG